MTVRATASEQNRTMTRGRNRPRFAGAGAVSPFLVDRSRIRRCIGIPVFQTLLDYKPVRTKRNCNAPSDRYPLFWTVVNKHLFKSSFICHEDGHRTHRSGGRRISGADGHCQVGHENGAEAGHRGGCADRVAEGMRGEESWQTFQSPQQAYWRVPPPPSTGPTMPARPSRPDSTCTWTPVRARRSGNSRTPTTLA